MQNAFRASTLQILVQLYNDRDNSVLFRIEYFTMIRVILRKLKLKLCNNEKLHILSFYSMTVQFSYLK